MPSLTIIGAQWGDEGKGKLVDYLTAGAQIVARFQGGNNAGHTLLIDGKTTKLSLMPSGILRPHTKCVIGAGVVLDPETLRLEIEKLAAAGVQVTPERLTIDSRVELVLEYHRMVDQTREPAKGDAKIGTTGRGIGPAYEDKAARCGVRMSELKNLELLKTKVEENIRQKNLYLKYVLQSAAEVDLQVVWSALCQYAELLLPFIGDVPYELHEALTKQQKVVFEGAQGTLLDGSFGTFPYVTSSHTIAGAVSTGAGIGPRDVGHVLGVAKSYCTRVGAGPFPTELHDVVGEQIRKQGAEFGTVTGRPRRCGWFDAVAMKYAVMLSGVESLAITKLDVLAGMEKVKLCFRYRTPGGEQTIFPSLSSELALAEPEYIEFEGWDSGIAQCKKWYQLPSSARLYLNAISEIIGCPVSIVSVGAERTATIFSSSAEYLKTFADS